MHICDVTHSYVWHDAFKCLTGLVYMCDAIYSCVTGLWRIHSVSSHAWAHASRRIHTCDMNHSYAWRDLGYDSFICGTWLIHMWDMTRVIWIIHRCDKISWIMSICVTESSIGVTESSICVTESSIYVTESSIGVTRFRYSVGLYIWMCHVYMCDMNHSYVRRDVCTCVP